MELLGCLCLGVALEDAGLRLDDLGERPERDAVSVGEAAALAPGDELRVGVDDARELVHEPALAHPRDGDERDELRRSLVRARDRRRHAGSRARCSRPTSSARAWWVTSTPKRERASVASQTEIGSALPFASTAGRLAILDRVAGRAVRRLVGEDAVDGGGALQAGSRVDDVAGGHSLAFGRARAERDERLAGRDADAQLESLLDREVADREGRADGALGVVLVRGRARRRAP